MIFNSELVIYFENHLTHFIFLLFQSFLPKLETLDASFNHLTKLERDFHGLPILCLANLTNNRITSISPELVAKTRCNSNTGVVNKLVILLEGMCITKYCRLLSSDQMMIFFIRKSNSLPR